MAKLIDCDVCAGQMPLSGMFAGEIHLEYYGERLTFMGEIVEKPRYSIALIICEPCAIKLLNHNKGILTSGR